MPIISSCYCLYYSVFQYFSLLSLSYSFFLFLFLSFIICYVPHFFPDIFSHLFFTPPVSFFSTSNSLSPSPSHTRQRALSFALAVASSNLIAFSHTRTLTLQHRSLRSSGWCNANLILKERKREKHMRSNSYYISLCTFILFFFRGFSLLRCTLKTALSRPPRLSCVIVGDMPPRMDPDFMNPATVTHKQNPLIPLLLSRTPKSF